MPPETDPTATPLEPLPYHRGVVAYLKTREAELWEWFASTQARADHADSLRGDLLKTTYRLDADAHPELYAQAREACARLALDVPITLYQSTQSGELNASLFHLPGEAHVVLYGPLLTLLDATEMQSVLGHELTHHHLWTREDGDFLVADRLIVAQASDPRAEASHVQTARRFRLYTEVFADRGALRATGDLPATVGALVKVQTGLATASGASYLRQADEIFAREDAARTEGISHPEAFIRARALRLWSEGDGGLDATVRAMIEGPPAVDELDLPAQVELSGLTRRWLAQLLRPRWFQTPATLAHARAFFEDFQPATAADDALPDLLRFADPKTREYLAYLLLDFCVADRELEDLPLAAAWEWSQRLGIDDVFDKLVGKELKLKPREWTRLKKDAPKMLAATEPRP